jgi:hypothetical protein
VNAMKPPLQQPQARCAQCAHGAPARWTFRPRRPAAPDVAASHFKGDDPSSEFASTDSNDHIACIGYREGHGRRRAKTTDCSGRPCRTTNSQATESQTSESQTSRVTDGRVTNDRITGVQVRRPKPTHTDVLFSVFKTVFHLKLTRRSSHSAQSSMLHFWQR